MEKLRLGAAADQACFSLTKTDTIVCANTGVLDLTKQPCPLVFTLQQPSGRFHFSFCFGFSYNTKYNTARAHQEHSVKIPRNSTLRKLKKNCIRLQLLIKITLDIVIIESRLRTDSTQALFNMEKPNIPVANVSTLSSKTGITPLCAFILGGGLNEQIALKNSLLFSPAQRSFLCGNRTLKKKPIFFVLVEPCPTHAPDSANQSHSLECNIWKERLYGQKVAEVGLSGCWQLQMIAP